MAVSDSQVTGAKCLPQSLSRERCCASGHHMEFNSGRKRKGSERLPLMAACPDLCDICHLYVREACKAIIWGKVVE